MNVPLPFRRLGTAMLRCAVEERLKGVTDDIRPVRRDRTTIQVSRRARSATPTTVPPMMAAMVIEDAGSVSTKIGSTDGLGTTSILVDVTVTARTEVLITGVSVQDVGASVCHDDGILGVKV